LGPNTFIEPDDPKLVYYVQRVLRPELRSLGVDNIAEVPRNQLVVKYGNGTSDASLLVMVYTPTQHHNLMDDPFSGKIASAARWGHDEPCVFGQGVGQNKSHQAIMLAVLKALVGQQVRLSGTLYLAINNEGRSSHRCSDAILATLGRKPEFAVLMTRTGTGISLGNRGRIDANIEVRGKASHSSVPEKGLSAIQGANEVLNRLKQVPLDGEHPLLGGRQAVAYQMLFEPLAPHTLPEVARLRIDRRLLPGDDPSQAVRDIRDTIGDLSPYRVRVEPGEYMLPALVDPEHPGVQALQLAHRAATGTDARTYYGEGTFDAGGPCAAGVPAVMYGVGGGDWPLGVDFVPVSHLNRVAEVMMRTVLSLLG
jgi:acetylornithine deacetylase/succinyl-diaminopimelate desuccinylase-like protein